MRVRVTVTDADTGQLLPCRIAARPAGAPAVWGRDARGQELRYHGAPRAWCEGTWEGDVPDTAAEVAAARPFEYVSASAPLAPGQDQQVELRLARHCDMASLGYYCGDAHQHVVHGEALRAVDLPLAAGVARAEGLDWSVFDARFTSVPGAEEPSPGELESLCRGACSDRFLALWADEYPKHDLGHLAALPGNAPVPPQVLGGKGLYRIGPGDRTPYTSFESVRSLQRYGGTAVYVHPLRELGGTPGRVGNIARELPVDWWVAPWAVEALDLMSDRVDDPQCWTLWYALLNRGHRIGLCAFNDACFDRAGDEWSEPVAYRRTYVRTMGPPTRRRIVAGIRRGRTFGTTGPLVQFEIDGEGPGHVFRAGSDKRTARIRAWGAPAYHDPTATGGLSAVELVRNGDVLRRWDWDEAPPQAEVTFPVSEAQTGWYLVRVCGSRDEQLAVTSPVYFATDTYRPPEPYQVQIEASVTDENTGQPLAGRMELLEYGCDRIDRAGSIEFAGGHLQARVPGDLRLRAAVAGYRPQTLSPILDCAPIYRALLGPIRADDLVDPAFDARVQAVLDRAELQFAMRREDP